MGYSWGIGTSVRSMYGNVLPNPAPLIAFHDVSLEMQSSGVPLISSVIPCIDDLTDVIDDFKDDQ